MNIEKIAKNIIIERLSGIAKTYNKNEIRVSAYPKSIMTIEFVDGVENPIIRTYRKNGDLLSYNEYKNYKRDGKGIKYYSHGITQVVAQFKDDKRVDAIEYDRYGRIKSERSYKKGKLHGLITMYDICLRKSEIRYSYGKIKAKTFYRQNNTKEKEYIYMGLYGYLNEIKHYNNKGKLLKIEYPQKLYYNF